MTQLLVLSEHDIAQTFTIADAISAVEDAYVQKARGTGVAWPMVYEQFAPGEADMDIRSGELAGSGLFGLKLTAWFGANPERGLPEIFGTVLLCDNRTGEPLALLNGSALTGMRTGAAGALGVAHLARKDARTLLVCGAGHQAAFQIAATLILRPAIDRVTVWDPRHASAPVARVEQIKAQVARLLADAGASSDACIEAVADGKAAVSAADAIITVTPATEPFIEAGWVRPGTHLSCVGADMPGKQEIASDLVAAARLFCDDRAQSVASGEFEVPAAQGAIAPEDIAAELGEVIAGTASGRIAQDEITVFDTSGIAVQDLASAKTAYDRAVDAGLGTTVSL